MIRRLWLVLSTLAFLGVPPLAKADRLLSTGLVGGSFAAGHFFPQSPLVGYFLEPELSAEELRAILSSEEVVSKLRILAPRVEALVITVDAKAFRSGHLDPARVSMMTADQVEDVDRGMKFLASQSGCAVSTQLATGEGPAFVMRFIHVFGPGISERAVRGCLVHAIASDLERGAEWQTVAP